MDHRQIFGQKLSEAITRKGIKQCDLATGIGLKSESSISRYINGTRSPNIDTSIKIAEFLNVSINELLDVDDPRVKQPEPDVAILFSCYSVASDEDRMVLWALMDRYMTDDQRIVIQGIYHAKGGRGQEGLGS